MTSTGPSAGSCRSASTSRRAICGDHAARTPDAPALIQEQADGRVRTWSYGEVETCASRFANALAALGVGRGSIVAIHLPQCPETLIAHVAIQKLGAIALPLFTLFGPDAVRYRLQTAAPACCSPAPPPSSAPARPCAISTRSPMS